MAGRDERTQLRKLARLEKFRTLGQRADAGAASFPGAWERRLVGILWGGLSTLRVLKVGLLPPRRRSRGPWAVMRDVAAMIQLVWRDQLEPCSYFVFRLYEGGREKRRVRAFLTGWEFHYICRYLCRKHGLEVGRLARKDRFAEFCGRHALPHAPSLPLERAGETQAFLRTDLFAKPVDRFGGDGCILLPYDSSTDEWSFGGETLAATALKATLDRHFGDEPYVVQERLRNHASLARFSRNSLCTVRMLSATHPMGKAAVVRATFRFPASREAVIDNSCKGGWSAPVSPSRGVLTAPARIWEDDREISALPDGTGLVGFPLPFWEEALTAVRRAHELASPFNFLGWDVALTDDGPVLMECNVWSDVELVEIPQREPFLTREVLEYVRAEPVLRSWLEKEGTRTRPPFSPSAVKESSTEPDDASEPKATLAG